MVVSLDGALIHRLYLWYLGLLFLPELISAVKFKLGSSGLYLCHVSIDYPSRLIALLLGVWVA